jgi:hypothetical protein
VDWAAIDKSANTPLPQAMAYTLTWDSQVAGDDHDDGVFGPEGRQYGFFYINYGYV